MLLQITVKEGLQDPNRQLPARGVERQRSPPFPGVPVHGQTDGRAQRLRLMENFVGRYLRQQTVDGLKLLRGVADVLQLHHRKAGRMPRPRKLGPRRLECFPAGLRRGEGMVPVSDGIEQGSLAGLREARPCCRLILAQRLVQRRGVIALHQPPRDMPAALHELKVVYGREGGLFHLQTVQHTAFGIVHQKHHMACLQARPAPYSDTRGNALHHGLFRSADSGGRVAAVVVFLQVDHAHDAPANRSVLEFTLHIDKGRGKDVKDVLAEIAAHRGVDGLDTRVLIAAQLRLRKDDMISGRRLPRLLTHRVPVFRLGGELVAGDHRPVVQQLSVRDQQLRRLKNSHHQQLLAFIIVCHYTTARRKRLLKNGFLQGNAE